MTKSELTRLLQKMNRVGTTMTVYSDSGRNLRTILDSITPLRVQGKYFWLLWKSVGYTEGPPLIETVKIIDHFVNSYLEDEEYGQQWLTVTFQDDRNRLFLVEVIEPFCEPEAHQKWRKWQRYREEQRQKFEKTDAGILKEQQQIADGWEDGWDDRDS